MLQIMFNDELRQAFIALHLLVPTPSDDFVSLAFQAQVICFQLHEEIATMNFYKDNKHVIPLTIG